MSNIKITLGKIETILQTNDALKRVSELQKKSLPAKLRYWFNKGLDIIVSEKNKINEVKNELFEQYGDKDEKGKLIKTDIGNDKFIPKLSNENLIKVQNEINSLLSDTIDLGFKKIVIDSNKLPDLDGFEMEILSMFYMDSEDTISE